MVMTVFNALLFLYLRDYNYLFLVLYILSVLLQTAFIDGRVKDLLPADLGYPTRPPRAADYAQANAAPFQGF
jgi:hypothetical protein